VLIGKICFAARIVFSVVELMMLNSAVTGKIRFDKILLPLLGLFFAVLGNLFYSVKPNYFVGIRTPWALENEENWRRTHHFSAKLWFAGGILAAIVTLFLPMKAGVILFSIIAGMLAIIPFVYSYRIYKSRQQSS